MAALFCVYLAYYSKARPSDDCPRVQALAKVRAYYAKAQSAVQAMLTPTQVKDGTQIAAPTSLTPNVDDACRSHAMSFLECMDMHNGNLDKCCKDYIDTWRECAKLYK